MSFAVTLISPDPEARGELARWLDVLGENTLPTWWSTALLLTVALACAVTGVAARAGGVFGAGAWFAGAGVVGAFSLAELSGVHRRLGGVGRLVLGEGALTRNWFAMAAVVVPVVAAVLLVLAARVGAPSSRLLADGGVLLMVSAVGGEFVAALLGGRTGPVLAPVLVAHLGELGENVGAALMLAAAVRALVLSRAGDALTVRHRRAARGRDAVPMRLRALGWWLGGVSVALTLLSLGFVLADPAHPLLRDLRLYVDLLVEHNLPTWWSVALLAAAALAHFAAFVAARNAGTPGAVYWLVTAGVLAFLSLDDQSQLHERSEELGRLVVTETSDFPFYWLIPGALAGLGVAAAVVALAVRVHARPRGLLVGGIALMLAAGLGLEVVQGLFMAAGNEGTGFVMGYHVEELGEDIGVILLIGAAVSMTRLSRAGGLALEYADHPAHLDQRESDAGIPGPISARTGG
ncbi:hypothetical protein K1T35_31635 [Pseudonocardia sp. DSM 110487]|uniref:hypothetical protein n=1 Tax=Pseudonocardia sp. DSM 110487 TaxID=2865833 RepID=UPI001C6A77DF|nr:hypothetical protein [Pseudonocardia sp. DSM 110487]QYN33065.1 hypothetical protein K1T35_31635 [Pseudonocardia sp. DSM 110487]